MSFLLAGVKRGSTIADVVPIYSNCWFTSTISWSFLYEVPYLIPDFLSAKGAGAKQIQMLAGQPEGNHSFMPGVLKTSTDFSWWKVLAFAFNLPWASMSYDVSAGFQQLQIVPPPFPSCARYTPRLPLAFRWPTSASPVVWSAWTFERSSVQIRSRSWLSSSRRHLAWSSSIDRMMGNKWE